MIRPNKHLQHSRNIACYLLGREVGKCSNILDLDLPTRIVVILGGLLIDCLQAEFIDKSNVHLTSPFRNPRDSLSLRCLMLFLNIQNQKVKTWLRFQTVISHEKAFSSLKMFICILQKNFQPNWKVLAILSNFLCGRKGPLLIPLNLINSRV